MRRSWVWMVMVVLAAAGCAGGTSAPTGGTPSARLVLPPDTDPDRGAREIASRARGAEVVYLGEMHDNARHHALQVRVLEAIVSAGGRPALAFEMVPESQQRDLDRAVRSDDTAEGVERRLRWHQQGWPDFRMYWPLFEQARELRLPVVAADLDPGVTRQINRDGLVGLREDPGRLRSALPPDPVLDRTITRRIQTVHCDLVPDPRAARMLESWYARNVTIARARGRGPPRGRPGAGDHRARPPVAGRRAGPARRAPSRDAPVHRHLRRGGGRAERDDC